MHTHVHSHVHTYTYTCAHTHACTITHSASIDFNLILLHTPCFLKMNSICYCFQFMFPALCFYSNLLTWTNLWQKEVHIYIMQIISLLTCISKILSLSVNVFIRFRLHFILNLSFHDCRISLQNYNNLFIVTIYYLLSASIFARIFKLKVITLMQSMVKDKVFRYN